MDSGLKWQCVLQTVWEQFQRSWWDLILSKWKWRRPYALWRFLLLCAWDKISTLLHHELPDDLPAEGEGKGVCCCSNLVLCFHVGHILGIGVTDGDHPVSHPDSGLSCLSTRCKLEENNNLVREGYQSRYNRKLQWSLRGIKTKNCLDEERGEAIVAAKI